MKRGPIKQRDLFKILRRYHVEIDPSRGKGSHMMLRRIIEGIIRSYPLPDRDEYNLSYVAALRRRFELTDEHGVTDDDFYS